MDLKNKKIALAAFGLENRSVYNYLISLGVKKGNITISDNNELTDTPKDVQTIFGEDAFEKLQDFDIVFRSPPISPDRINTKGKVWSSTNEFFSKCPSKNIIGITGTKGKGTTSALISEIMKAAGKTVHLLGNIGIPSLDVLPKIRPEDIVVFEMSSFQLWDIEYSPHVAVVLMIEPDHLDVHKDLSEYRQAKSNIVKKQKTTDYVFYHPDNSGSADIVVDSAGVKIPYMSEQSANIVDNHIVINGQKVCSVDEVGLIGKHNLENICAAVSAAWLYAQDIDDIAVAIKSFKGLPHRLELVKEVDGVKYIDDSISTNPGTAIAAINAFPNPKHLFIGGSDKGQEYTELVSAISNSTSIKSIILIGETGQKIREQLQDLDFDTSKIIDFSTMKHAIDTLKDRATTGDIVLLSPGSASFGDFIDYKDRAGQFAEAVKSLSS